MVCMLHSWMKVNHTMYFICLSGLKLWFQMYPFHCSLDYPSLLA
jgi:hypothetical protein